MFGNLARLGVALFRAIAHLLHPQRSERIDLLLRTNLEAIERERVIHPTEIEMDEQADAESGYVYIDLLVGCHGAGSGIKMGVILYSRLIARECCKSSNHATSGNFPIPDMSRANAKKMPPDQKMAAISAASNLAASGLKRRNSSGSINSSSITAI